MSAEKQKLAEACLVAVCAHLAMPMAIDKKFQMWMGVLRDVIADCAECPGPMEPVRDAADRLAFSPPGRDQENALLSLKIAVRRYFEMAAAQRHKRWRDG